MKKLVFVLYSLCLSVSLIGCGNSTTCSCSCGNCSCCTTQDPANTTEENNEDPLKTGAYVFKVTDSNGNPIKGVEFDINVVRCIGHDTRIQTDGQTFDIFSDEDGDVYFTLSQLEKVEENGDYGLWSMSDVENKTPEEDKKIEESGYGERTVEGLHCTDDKGGVYTGFYETNNCGEYRTYSLEYSYQGERYNQHAIHQVDLQWNWERTLNALFTRKITINDWDDETNGFVQRVYDGGHIAITLTECPDGYNLKNPCRKIYYNCVTSGSFYDKYASSADYVFVSNNIVLDSI